MKELWNKLTDYFGTSIIHPQFLMLRYTKEAVEEAKRRARGKLIDVGCGRMPYRKILEPLVESYIGVDHPRVSRLYKGGRRPEVLADAVKLPFKKKTFDIALMLQVLEYLENPGAALREIGRVLKGRGILILSSPFLYPIHDLPYDRYRFTKTAIRSLLNTAGFRPLKIEAQGGFWEFWCLSLNVFLVKRVRDLLQTKNAFSLLLIILLLLVTPILVLGTNIVSLLFIKLGKVSPKYPNYFPLNYLVVARKG